MIKSSLTLKDVGDGMNLRIYNNYPFRFGLKDNELTVDFGGNKNIDCYTVDDNFLLSHFHSDHYNHCLRCQGNRIRWMIDKFYYPIMPEFEQSKIFFLSLLAMNIRISPFHPLHNSIFGIIKSLNYYKKITFIPLSKGDKFECGGVKYEILWPPKEVKDENILYAVKNAIKDFEQAKKTDSLLNQIYSSLREISTSEEIQFNNREELNINWQGKELNEIVIVANKSLKKAANRLSVAFRENDNLLFLGDLEKKEINLVVSELIKRNDIYYNTIVAAHHGTHWDDILKSLHSIFCLASVGPKLNRYISNEYKSICMKFIKTVDWGDIHLISKLKLKITH